MNCPNCNSVNQDGSAFCNRCGSRLGASGGVSAPGSPMQQYGGMQNSAQRGGGVFGGQNRSQSPNLEKPNYSAQYGQGSQYGQSGFGEPAADGAAPAVLKKNNTMLIAIIAVAAVLLIGGLIFFLFSRSDGKRIATAFSSTFNAKSFVADCEFSAGGEAVSGTLESCANGNDSFFLLSGTYDGVKADMAYYQYALYVGSNGEYQIFSRENLELDDKEMPIFEALQKVAEHDYMGAVKTLDNELADLKEEVGNYDQSPDILKNMAADFFKDKENSKFITNYEKDGNTFKFTININQLILTAYDDYGLKISDELASALRKADDIVVTDLTLELNGKYLSRLEAKAYEQDRPGSFVTAKLCFTDVDKVTYGNSRTSKVIEECKASGATAETNNYVQKSKLKTANANAKVAYNATAECFADAETQGYSVRQVFDCSNDKWFIESGRVYDAQQQYDSAAGKIAEVLRYNGENAGYFKVIKQEINGRDSFVVFWSQKEDSEFVGRYPDAVTWDAFHNAGTRPDIYSIVAEAYNWSH